LKVFRVSEIFNNTIRKNRNRAGFILIQAEDG